jgi:hypothetical protein
MKQAPGYLYKWGPSELRHLQSVSDLYNIGFSLIPLKSEGKTPPEGFKWRRYQNQAAPLAQVEAWQEGYPDCNWASVWGSTSGLMAVDIDSAAAFGWCQRQGGFNATMPIWYETGRGWQYVFRLPEDLLNVRGVNPHEGVELRCNGQYSVIPPSIHPSGKPYQWKRAPSSLDDIPYPPSWVLRILRGEVPEEKTPGACEGWLPFRAVKIDHPKTSQQRRDGSK